MQYPLITIAIATYNSEELLPKTLKSIKKQDYPQELIEIIVMDGGSSDATRQIAKKYKCKIIDNVERDPVPGKHKAYLRAKGKYLIYLDSDEVIEKRDSLRKKVDVFTNESNVKILTSSGYKKPRSFPDINYYINEFGDPFSFFIYRLSKDERYYLRQMIQRYKVLVNDKNFVIFDLRKTQTLPIIELVAMCSMVDLPYLRKNFPQLKKNKSLITHAFYLINRSGGLLAITKADAIVHFSASNVKNYQKKISSRVKNNIYKTTMGLGGFELRDKYQPDSFRYKKYLFLPYSLLVIPALVDSILLSFSRRNVIYMLHVYLSFYTAIIIIYYYLLKLIGLKANMKGYGV